VTVETAAERNAMLADFGVDAIFDPATSSHRTVKGIFDNIYEEVEAGGRVGIAMQQPRFFCKTADISGAGEGDALEIGSVPYTIKVIMSDGNGMSELVLELD